MRRLVFVGIALASAIASTGAQAGESPSFDCSAAKSAVEVLICGNEILAVKDVQLAADYKFVIRMSATLPINRDELLKEQREWLKARSRSCGVSGPTPPSNDVERFRATVCLIDLYARRVWALTQTVDNADRELRHLEPGAPPEFLTRDIVDDDQLRQMTQLLQHDGLNRFFPAPEVTIESCDSAVSVFGQGPGHDSSYGTHCKVRVAGDTVDVFMCNDYLVGNFGIRLSEAVGRRDHVARFAEEVCPPGG
jgi:uncharacterized protein YecT (DUF1311 family)